MFITASMVKRYVSPRQAVSLLTHTLVGMFGHDEFRRFIVLSRSRTGSNLLISLLNSHPNIRAAGEIFSSLDGRDYNDILTKVFARQPRRVKARGFKIFYYHPRDDRSSAIWDALESSRDLHVIHLRRRNILRTLVSRKIAGVQDVWLAKATEQHRNTGEKGAAITFTVDELREGFEETRQWEASGESRFRSHPLISVEYEDLQDNREPTFRKVTEFLGVRYQPPRTELIKQNTRSLRETITNYDELRSAFFGTEWETFFED